MTTDTRSSATYDCVGCGETVPAGDAVTLWADAPLGRTAVKAHAHCALAARSSILDRGWRLAPKAAPEPKKKKSQPKPSAADRTLTLWDGLAKAYPVIAAGQVQRIDGPGWKAYRVRDDLVRIDVNANDISGL